MSKKRRLKVEKITKDETLNEQEKEALVAQLEDDCNKKQKKTFDTDFKDKRAYIENERTTTADQKANTSKLWGDEEKNFLEDVTMDLIPDDDAIRNIKGKTAMKWDAKKKRYMLKKVDRDGKVIAEKKNESGIKITKKMKEKEKDSIYKKWQQKTHLSLQKSGEMEDNKIIDQGKRANEARRTLKEFKSRHGQDLYKGEDARDHSKLLEKKSKKFMQKVRDNSAKEPKKKKGGRSFSDRAMDKIQIASRPTRSKMIVRRK